MKHIIQIQIAVKNSFSNHEKINPDGGRNAKTSMQVAIGKMKDQETEKKGEGKYRDHRQGLDEQKCDEKN